MGKKKLKEPLQPPDKLYRTVETYCWGSLHGNQTTWYRWTHRTGSTV